MQVTIEGLGPFKRHLPEGEKTVTINVPEGGTVGDALRSLGVAEGEQWNASVGGQLVYASTEVSEGDHLLVFTPIAGG